MGGADHRSCTPEAAAGHGVVDTSTVLPDELEDTVRHALWQSFSRVDVDHHSPKGGISGRMRLGSLGPIRVCSARATPVTVRRTARMVREDDERAVFLGLQMTGTNLVTQYDRQSLVGPGHLVIFESDVPYTLHFGQGVGYHSLRIPRRALALTDRALREIGAVPLGPGDPTVRLAFTYFAELAASEDLRRGAHAEALVAPSMELLRAVVSCRLDGSGAGRNPRTEAPLDLRITQYVREHLADPSLSAARIAEAHGISTRHLYAVLARSGISLGDWIRSRRLAECRRELAEPNGRRRTVAGIGRRWGFVDASHFSRVFRQEYGMSPRDWREQHHPAHREPQEPEGRSGGP
ncbi:helix-turn-helix domain-containing protein [Streptomyces sp. NPDC059173]|uniref:helix-turn-helix domain-containing protein n=1 Tax=unclassified Streptomyces TaxID=2593676 RepID=UPI00369D64A7